MYLFFLRSVPVLQSKLSDNTITQNMMGDIYSTIILIYSLLHLTTATGVYYVTPYDQSDINSDCPIDHECHTLQYYLLNSSKYFTSNTQLHFLQGIFYINADIVIDSLHNFSLVGSGVNDTLIECSTPSLIAIINCTNTVIKNITTGSQCGGLAKTYFNILKYMRMFTARYMKPTIYKPPIKAYTAIYIFNSYSTLVQSVLMKTHGMFIINGLGNTILTNIALYHGDLEIFYINDKFKAIQRNSSHIVWINNFKYYGDKKVWHIIMIEFWQDYYHTEVYIENTVFQYLKQIELIGISFWHCGLDKYLVTIKRCEFLQNTGVSHNSSGIITVLYPLCFDFLEDKWLNTDYNIKKVQILDSNFINNTAYHELGIIMKLHIMLTSHYRMTYFTISNCTFVMNNNFVILKTPSSALLDIHPLPIFIRMSMQDVMHYTLFSTITVNNSVFIQTGSGHDMTILYCHNAVLNLNGPLVFKNFKGKVDSIINAKTTNITIHGYIEFFDNNAVSLLSQKEFDSVQLKENLLLNISNNKFYDEIFSTYYTTNFLNLTKILENSYPMCYLQYASDCGNLDHRFAAGELINFSIIIHKTEARSLSNLHTTHCRWQPNSAFNTTSPLLVNQRFISDFDKWNDILNVQTERSLCSCSDADNANCTVDILGPIYPGQNAVFNLALMDTKQLPNTNETVPIDLETFNYSPMQCTVPIASTQQNVRSHECTNLSYTLLSHSSIMCELLLKQGLNTRYGVRVFYSKFYVKLLPCPPGFLFTQMRCQCNPVLTLNGYVKDCNINDQTVLRCPNSWIFYSQSLHTYQLSKNCPFDYCYPQSSKLNLNNPELQCQFSRSGSLCGQCQQGLSTIFGSNKCQQCSDVYLLLIIPIAISGIVLVIIMFVLNLTVSEGTINPFILYFNILNIHNIPLFPSHSLVKPLHVIISFANLNLGIETCFYNGMDDYTKAWLQFSFPIYLIMIIVSIIIISCYSIILQRLTLHKTVPVLATILLLSYTKILQTTSNVLLMYSTITYYPSNPSSVMWSIDANVPLFGLCHSILFAFSLLIFLSLILYICLLLFGRYLRNFKFRVIVYINPLLNACNKPYRDNCCYWLGYELIIRCVLLGIYLAVNNSTISLVIGNSFLSMIQFNFQHPFQSNVNNISQMVLNLNLLILYSTSLMLSVDQSMRVVVVNIMVGCGVVQFILMIIINQFTCECCQVNVFSYIQRKLFSKKKSDNIDRLIVRQDDCDISAINDSQMLAQD